MPASVAFFLIAVVAITVHADLIGEYMKVRPKDPETTMEEYDFDWIAYVDAYADLAVSNLDADAAWQHYYGFGKKENRIYPRRFPDTPSLNTAETKLNNYVTLQQQRNVQEADRTLVMYYLPMLPDGTSHDALINTLKIFISAMVKDSAETSSNFYWFNVLQAGSLEPSPFLRYIPDLPHAAVLTWSTKMEQNLIQIRTLDLLHTTGMTKSFGSVFFGDIYSRGPLSQMANGEWLKSYRSLINSNNVGLAGSSFSCELVPHVQNHSWSIHRNIIPVILKAFPQDNFQKWKGAVRYNLQYISVLVMKKYNVSSILYRNSLNEDYYHGKCLASKSTNLQPQSNTKNPVYWCNINLPELIFIPWSYNVYLQLCEGTKLAMHAFLYEFNTHAPVGQKLHIPETVYTGALHDLTMQHNHEMFRAVEALRNKNNHPSNVAADGKAVIANQACLLVRSSYVHSQDRNISIMDEDYFSGFDNFAKSMLRQTDGNWIAYFFLTDHHPFGLKLKRILDSYQDSRLQYLHISKQHRPAYTSLDAGYTPTDTALRKVMEVPQCRLISFTNADNIYGSDVIRRVRSVATHEPDHPKMVLTPLDSRNFIYQDLMGRNGGAVGFQSVCTALLVVLEVNTLGLAVQPRPILGKIDLAGVFFDREQLIKEKIFFSNFTHPKKYPCTGCQDGYFTEYLVQNRHWRYQQLGVEGLQSIVFHGPSPIWCVASGLVWFGHPNVNKARCFTHSVINRLRQMDTNENGADTSFDWGFHDAIKRVCLQFTPRGNELYLSRAGK